MELDLCRRLCGGAALAGTGGTDGRVELPRGDLLVFGGDQVYPSASRGSISVGSLARSPQRLETTCRGTPHVYAIPGNHDWYDGLSAFTRLFCSDIGGRRLAGWWTRQRRSYFVLKLSHGWWLIGSDGQLQSDLDVPQMEHFREIAARYMKPGDKVILCLSLPAWISRRNTAPPGSSSTRPISIFLREEVFARLGVDVKVYLAGDCTTIGRHEETRESAAARNRCRRSRRAAAAPFCTRHTKKTCRSCRRRRSPRLLERERSRSSAPIPT